MAAKAAVMAAEQEEAPVVAQAAVPAVEPVAAQAEARAVAQAAVPAVDPVAARAEAVEASNSPTSFKAW